MFHVMSEESYEDGQVIVQEGGSGDWIYVVLSGRIELSRTVEGKKFVIERLGPGDVFGEVGFFGGIVRAATARAVGKSKVGVIDRSLLDTELNKLSPAFRTVLMTTMDRFKKMIDRASEFSARAEPRHSVNLPVTYKDEKSFFKVVTRDLSSNGLFIKTENPLEPGHRFLVNLRLPDRIDSIIIKCEVVWVREKGVGPADAPAGMGVRFIDMTDKDHELLEGYVKHLAKQDGEQP